MFGKPDPNNVSGMKTANYDKLTEKGYPKNETVVTHGDMIIGTTRSADSTGMCDGNKK